MHKILMILTHNRLDCLSLTLDMLDRAQAYAAFDRVVFLLNGVSPRHMAFVDRYIRTHPDVSWDKILGSGIRPTGISDMQNRCVRIYPGGFYVKVDDDVFVPRGWAERLTDAYEQNKHRDHLALITPLIPNNGFGLYQLLTRFYPEHLKEYRRRFRREPTPERQGHTWQHATVGEWASRLFLDIDAANEEQRRRLSRSGHERFLLFPDSFSIGCIAYDYRHWEKMGGIPKTDEPGWTAWITEHGQVNVLDQSLMVLHYAFFVQQEWLDRSSLLEDIRRVNLPGTSNWMQRTGLTRAARLARQIPGILRRRLAPRAAV